MNAQDNIGTLFSFQDFGELLVLVLKSVIAAAVLVGADVVVGFVVGSLIAAVLIGVLGARARDRNSIIAVLMPFGLGCEQLRSVSSF